MDAPLHHAGGSSRSVQSESPLPSSQTAQTETPKSKPFTPFCNVDQVQISIHCHINAVKSLLCVPGLVPKDLGTFQLTYCGLYIICNHAVQDEGVMRVLVFTLQDGLILQVI